MWDREEVREEEKGVAKEGEQSSIAERFFFDRRRPPPLPPRVENAVALPRSRSCFCKFACIVAVSATCSLLLGRKETSLSCDERRRRRGGRSRETRRLLPWRQRERASPPRIRHSRARARSNSATSVSGRGRRLVRRCEERSRRGWGRRCRDGVLTMIASLFFRV